MFLEDLPAPEPGWWTYIAWGTAPDWVAAIGTVGTLAIALGILLMDRRKRVRNQADRFATWTMTTYAKHGSGEEAWTLDVYAYNGSDAPIPVAVVRSKSSQKPNFIKPLAERDQPSGPPKWIVNAQEQVHVSIPLEVNPKTLSIVIDFVDSQGNQWHRHLNTNKYMSQKKFLKFIELAEEDKGKYRDPAELVG